MKKSANSDNLGVPEPFIFLMPQKYVLNWINNYLFRQSGRILEANFAYK